MIVRVLKRRCSVGIENSEETVRCETLRRAPQPSCERLVNDAVSAKLFDVLNLQSNFIKPNAAEKVSERALLLDTSGRKHAKYAVMTVAPLLQLL
jgi:hypothetical protein